MGNKSPKDHLKLIYLRDSPSGKTKVWQVSNETTGEIIGYIRWHGPWRKYCFFTTFALIFDANCLRQLQEFLESAQRTRSK